MNATNDRSQVPATSVTTWKIDQEASRVEFTGSHAPDVCHESDRPVAL